MTIYYIVCKKDKWGDVGYLGTFESHAAAKKFMHGYLSDLTKYVAKHALPFVYIKKESNQ